MRFRASSRCHVCKVPLNINMTGTIYEIYFWLHWQVMTNKDINISNSIYYKRIGKKWTHLCIDCFQPVPKFRHVINREITGIKNPRPREKCAFNDQQLDFMIRSMINYHKHISNET